MGCPSCSVSMCKVAVQFAIMFMRTFLFLPLIVTNQMQLFKSRFKILDSNIVQAFVKPALRVGLRCQNKLRCKLKNTLYKYNYEQLFFSSASRGEIQDRRVEGACVAHVDSRAKQVMN